MSQNFKSAQENRHLLTHSHSIAYTYDREEWLEHAHLFFQAITLQPKVAYAPNVITLHCLFAQYYHEILTSKTAVHSACSPWHGLCTMYY